MSETRAKKIQLILFDVDGVLTDGTIWPVPASDSAQFSGTEEAGSGRGEIDSAGRTPAHDTFTETKGFHAHDGIGFSLARLAGLKTGMITKRISPAVAQRGKDLKLEYVMQGVDDKAAALEQVLQREHLTAEEVAYLGDDIVDLGVMRRCGLAAAVPNAREEVLHAAHFVTAHRGGEGAARDLVEYVLRAQGRLQQIVELYLKTSGGQTKIAE